ncbi:hypothetical protein C1H87_18660 [Flavivirga eckloniae]|uniref:HmuY protein n=2 Tax=Flavivirga eckloniae TaxID=1803846 RepID=A0A2K9PXB4_9FLAO|nr:hypothetical protein C1H87_18660 [Flavivirga eckloniae]
MVNIQIHSETAIYGQDFVTIPEVVNDNISLPVVNGALQNAIAFKKLNTTLDETTTIEFTIASIDYSHANIQGNSRFIINASPALGGSLTPEVGGPNQGNQVYVDLSTQSTTLARRDSWDIGFYNGDSFRVTINGSLYMATKALNHTNIDLVTDTDVTNLKPQVAVGTFNPENAAYIDAPNGNILETAIAEIAENANENPVYLLNLGYEVGTATPPTGSVAIAGNHRGWKKIRILKHEDGYILQYANLNDTTHQEITISKNSDYNFTHFSFNTNSLVNVEPKKEKWDISFTVFTNILEGAGSYGFSDYVIHNRKANTLAYQVNTADFNYDDFSLTDIDDVNFSKNQTTIGSHWRDVFNRTTFSDRFYIIKDPNGNIYKLKFLAMANSSGERGHPEFEYKLLQ